MFSSIMYRNPVTLFIHEVFTYVVSPSARPHVIHRNRLCKADCWICQTLTDYMDLE